MNDSIPRLLAESLVQTMGDHGSILVGSAPSSFPPEVLTEEFELLGGLVLSTTSITVLRATTTDSSALRYKLPASLASAGFAPPPEARATGFVVDDEPDFRQYTKGETGIMLRFMHRPPHGTLVHVVVGPRFDHDAHFRRMTREDREESAPMPQLRAPAATRVGDSGGGGSGNFRHIRCSLLPPLLPDVALAHYHAQLLDQGWSTVGSTTDARSAAASYVRDDAHGFRWSGMLCIAHREDTKSTVISFALVSLSGRGTNRGTTNSMERVQ